MVYWAELARAWTLKLSTHEPLNALLQPRHLSNQKPVSSQSAVRSLTHNLSHAQAAKASLIGRCALQSSMFLNCPFCPLSHFLFSSTSHGRALLLARAFVPLLIQYMKLTVHTPYTVHEAHSSVPTSHSNSVAQQQVPQRTFPGGNFFLPLFLQILQDLHVHRELALSFPARLS